MVSKKTLRKNVNVDPTRTLTLRKKFEADMKRRLTALKKAIYQFIVTENGIGLTVNASPYDFPNDLARIEAYKKWLLDLINRGLLSTDENGQPWLAEYIDSAYKQATIRSFQEVRAAKASENPIPVNPSPMSPFYSQIFGGPIEQTRVQLLFVRAFDQLKGITESMAGSMSRVLADGLANGLGARAVARLLADEVDGIGRRRALVIARTELIHAYAEGQLDSFEKLGVEEVGAEIEWKTAGDAKVCPVCRALEGKRFKISEARGKIPQHPNCRCAWIPYVDLAKTVAAIKNPSPEKAKATKAIKAQRQLENLLRTKELRGVETKKGYLTGVKATSVKGEFKGKDSAGNTITFAGKDVKVIWTKEGS